MNVSSILTEIDKQIANLQHARAVLTASGTGSSGVGSAKKRAKRKISAAGLARIRAAQKARWSKVKAAKKK